MKALALILALVCSQAMAEGVPLITPGAEISPSLELSIKNESKDTLRVIPIVLNREAFGANVLNVTLDGKIHTFVGQVMPNHGNVQWVKSWGGQEGHITHPGELREGDGMTLFVSLDESTGKLISVRLQTLTRTYYLKSRGVRDFLVQQDNAAPGSRSVPWSLAAQQAQDLEDARRPRARDATSH